MVLGIEPVALGMLGRGCTIEYILAPKVCLDYLCTIVWMLRVSILKMNHNSTYHLCICIVWAYISYLLSVCVHMHMHI